MGERAGQGPLASWGQATHLTRCVAMAAGVRLGSDENSWSVPSAVWGGVRPLSRSRAGTGTAPDQGTWVQHGAAVGDRDLEEQKVSVTLYL